MRIGIDAHALGTHAGGNETFIRQLLHGIRAVRPEADIVAYVHPEHHGAPDIAAGFPTYPLAVRSSWLRVPFALPAAVRATRANLLHVQYIGPPVLGRREGKACPMVVTLHDMVWKRFPQTLRRSDRLRLAALVPGTLRRAARIFVVTEAMKREAIDLYGLPEEKLDIVHNSVDPAYRPIAAPEEIARVQDKYGLARPFIAYMGAIQPRKNLVRLATAFSRLAARGFPHTLVLIGARTWLHDEIGRQIQALNLGERIRLTGYVDREDLPALLSAAEAFAYISLYEGFGLPVAEALACGAPTLISTDPALCEIAGDTAIRCEAGEVDAIEEGLVRVLSDEAFRAESRTAGPAQVRRFSREAMGRAALAGYERALA